MTISLINKTIDSDVGRKGIDELSSIMSKFHDDFKKVSDDELSLSKAKDQREKGNQTRLKLSKAKTTKSNISNLTNVDGGGIQSQNEPSIIMGGGITAKEQKDTFKTVLIPANKQLSKNIVHISKTIKDESVKDRNKQKSMFKNSIIEARIIEGLFTYVKDFAVGGASDADKLLNAVQNVEAAIRNEDKIILENRTGFERFTEKMPDSNIFKLISNQLGTMSNAVGDIDVGEIGKQLHDVVSGKSQVGENPLIQSIVGFMGEMKSSIKRTFNDKEEAKKSASETAKDKFRKPKQKQKFNPDDIVGSVIGMFTSGFKSSKTKDKSKKSGVEFVSSWLEDVIGSLSDSKFLSKKGAFLSAVAVFGNESDLAVAAAITNPIKTLKLGFKTLKVSLNTLLDRGYLQGIAGITTMFGAQAGVLSAVLIPLGKAFRFINFEVPSLSDGLNGLGGILSNMKGRVTEWGKRAKDTTVNIVKSIFAFGAKARKGAKDVNDTLVHGMGKMFNKFKKKIGKKMLAMGIWLGIRGAGMVGIMGTIMTIAMASLPFIIGGLIVAAIAGIGTYVYQNWDSISGWWGENIITPLVSFIMDGMEDLGSAVDTIGNFFTGIIDSVMDGLKSAIRAIPVFGDDLFNSIFSSGEATTSNDVQPSESTVPRETNGSRSGAVVNKKKSQIKVIENTPIVNQSKADIFKKVQEDIKSQADSGELGKSLQAILREMKEAKNRPRVVAPSPPPATNVEDVATYIVTQ